jgi:hypothetical protein
MPLKRTTHWATRELHDFFLARATQPFAWGSNDCCLFPADAIRAMTGVDLAEDFRGKYSDEASAFALIKEVTGGETVADAAAWCAQKHELPEWHLPLFAQRGDLVVVRDSGRLIAGIVGLTGRGAISVGEEGLKRLPLSAVVRAWKI